MRKLRIFVMITAATMATAAAAHDTTVPYSSRGDCESASADLSSDEWDFIMAIANGFFSTRGEVASFLTRQYSCDLAEDGNWYMTDHRLEVMGSGWFQQRNRN